jgi:hypothetical protein
VCRLFFSSGHASSAVEASWPYCWNCLNILFRYVHHAVELMWFNATHEQHCVVHGAIVCQVILNSVVKKATLECTIFFTSDHTAESYRVYCWSCLNIPSRTFANDAELYFNRAIVERILTQRGGCSDLTNAPGWYLNNSGGPFYILATTSMRRTWAVPYAVVRV